MGGGGQNLSNENFQGSHTMPDNHCRQSLSSVLLIFLDSCSFLHPGEPARDGLIGFCGACTGTPGLNLFFTVACQAYLCFVKITCCFSSLS